MVLPLFYLDNYDGSEVQHRLLQALAVEALTQTESPDWKKCKHCKIEKLKMQKCSVCKSARYCSVECQRADWPSHKKCCKKPTQQ